MKLNLGQLTRNKPALIGVAGAAGLGAIVWWRRRASGGAATASSTTTGGVQSGGQAVFDSTGTDLATAIGNLGEGLQRQLDDYFKNVQASPGEAVIPPSGDGSGGKRGHGPGHKDKDKPASPPPKVPPVVPPAPPKPAPVLPKPKYLPKFALVGSGNLHATAGKVMEKYHLTLGQFRTLNPGIGSGKAGRNTKLAPGTRVRIG